MTDIIKYTSLFSCAGIGETFNADVGLEATVSSELLGDRARYYQAIYKTSTMIPGDISRTKIYEILRNPFYAGIMCVKGKLMPHIHGKIIDKKLYDQVQQIMDAKGMESEIHKHQQKYKVKKFAFRGIVLCGRCHHLMSPDCKTKANGKQYTYLRCYNKCGQMPINETI